MYKNNVATKPTNLNGGIYVPRAAESPFTVTTQATLLIYFAVVRHTKKPPHGQAHLVCPTHKPTLQNQKSLPYPNPRQHSEYLH